MTWGLLAQVMTWGLVFLGWMLVNAQNNRREDRKEFRSSLDRLSQRIETLLLASVQYWCSDPNTAGSADITWEIKRNLEQVELNINRLVRRAESNIPWHWRKTGERQLAIAACNSRVLEAFDAWASVMTGGAFESKGRVAITTADSPLPLILLEANALIDRLEAAHDAFCGVKAPM